jgi:citrate synthase
MTGNSSRDVVRGLKDVAAAETRISYIDPSGSLYYLGYDIDDLIGHVVYSEVAYLLIHKRFPNRSELDTFNSELIENMRLPKEVVESIRCTPQSAHPMDVLRTEVSSLGEFDDHVLDISPEENLRKAVKLIAQVPTIVATIHRTRQGFDVPEPRPDLSFAENFLYLFNGRVPDKAEAEVMHRIMILHADHGFNASTFAARVTASTNADMYSAVTTAIGTLRGPIHGGASQKVMEMLDDIGLEAEVEEYIYGLLGDGKKIMGFGHRVYRAEDPRTKHLRNIVQNLCNQKRTMELYNKCATIEGIVHQRKNIYPNVDFYAAVAMDALGIPKDYYTPFFAASRIVGWVSHIIEQYEDAVLLRPLSNYVGEFGRPFVPLDKR